MNIVLVVYDSLRKDCVGCYNSSPSWGRVKTPHLDALANESLVMTRVFPESLPTIPARRALYTGERVYPFVNGDGIEPPRVQKDNPSPNRNAEKKEPKQMKR